jgi:hypothetical protein
MSSEPLEIRVRLFIAGELADEVTFPIGVGTRDLSGVLGAHHGQMVRDASGPGELLPYMIEIRFPDGDHLRWGTDPAGMVWPIDTALLGLIDKLGG